MESMIRQPILLDGEWLFIDDPAECGAYTRDALWENAPYRIAHIPSDTAHVCPERSVYHPETVSWYRKTVLIPESYAHRRVVLHFEAVNYRSAVFVNGQYVGGSEQGFLPFDLDITKAVRINEVNAIVVHVDGRRRSGELPCSFYWKNCSGILRSVWLYATAEAYIGDFAVNGDCDGNAEINAEVCGSGSLRLRVTSADGTELYNAPCAAHEVVHLVGIQKWHPDTPVLYAASLSLESEGQVVDTVETRFSFRTVEARDGKILLNGAPIFLKGYNRHEDHPVSGGAACHEVVDADFRRIKESGANFIRMCHYPHDRYEPETADRLGLLLLVEIPVVALRVAAWGITDASAQIGSDNIWRNAKEMLTRMIRRDRSHPSIILWSVSNETNERDDGVNDINAALLRLVRKLDPTRLRTHVSMLPYIRDDAEAEHHRLDDVVCFNFYPYWGGSIQHRNHDYDTAESVRLYQDQFEYLAKLHPGKPMVVTEFGCMTNNAFLGADGEACQVACIESECAVIEQYAAGCSVWAYADHLWPVPDAVAGELSTFGLVTRDRKPKPSFEVYSRWMKSLPQ